MGRQDKKILTGALITAPASFLTQRAQSRGIFIYRYSPGMPARHAGTLCQPRGFCCLPVNGLFRSAAGSAALLIFLLMLILKMLLYYFLCFLSLCPHGTPGTGISGIGIYISALEASRTASGCPFLSGCLLPVCAAGWPRFRYSQGRSSFFIIGISLLFRHSPGE